MCLSDVGGRLVVVAVSRGRWRGFGGHGSLDMGWMACHGFGRHEWTWNGWQATASDGTGTSLLRSSWRLFSSKRLFSSWRFRSSRLDAFDVTDVTDETAGEGSGSALAVQGSGAAEGRVLVVDTSVVRPSGSAFLNSSRSGFFFESMTLQRSATMDVNCMCGQLPS